MPPVALFWTEAVLNFWVTLMILGVGWAFIRVILKSKDNSWQILFLAPAAGLSVVVFCLFWEVYFLGRMPGILALPVCVLLLASLVLRIREESWQRPRFIDFQWILPVVLLAGIFVSAILLKSPFGTGIDVWAIWKLKARFLFYSVTPWADISSREIAWSHTAYPIFYPLALNAGWLLAGKEWVTWAWSLALLSSVGCVGLIVTSFVKTYKKAGALAALGLLSTPHWVGMGGSQYADILLVYFLTAFAVLLVAAEEEKNNPKAFLAGLFLGASAFIKNEGILFLGVYAFVWLIFGISCRFERKNFFKYATQVLWGVMPYLIVVILFKLRVESYDTALIAPAFLDPATRGSVFLDKADTILSFLKEELVYESKWVYGWIFLIAGTILLGLRKKLQSVSFLFWLLVGVSGAFLLNYLWTPQDTLTLMKTSFDRIFLSVYTLGFFLLWKILFTPQKTLK